MSDAPENGRRSRRKGYYKRQVELEAAKQGLTVEEYGVYKGSVGSGVEPINSAGGLLFLAVLTSWVELIIGFATVLFLVPVSWAYYLKERKAVRLRRASGKTLQHPTRRSMVRD